MGEELETVGELTERDLWETMVEEQGHVAPPENARTVDDYLAIVQAKGGNISRNTALQTLLARREAGEIEGCKMNVGGRQRWLFWEAANGDGQHG